MFKFQFAPVLFLLALTGCSGIFGRDAASPYEQQVAAYKAQIANGTLASVPSGAAAQATGGMEGEGSGVSPLAPAFHEFMASEAVAQLDRAKFWWTDTPKPRRNKLATIVLVVSNTTDKPLNGASFRLSDEPCGSPSPGTATDLVMPAPIPPGSKAAISFELEISRENALRRNELACGEIIKAW